MATFSGSDTGIFISVNLARLFENKLKKVGSTSQS